MLLPLAGQRKGAGGAIPVIRALLFASGRVRRRILAPTLLGRGGRACAGKSRWLVFDVVIPAMGGAYCSPPPIGVRT